MVKVLRPWRDRLLVRGNTESPAGLSGSLISGYYLLIIPLKSEIEVEVEHLKCSH